jgi:hypothetical protein
MAKKVESGSRLQRVLKWQVRHLTEISHIESHYACCSKGFGRARMQKVMKIASANAIPRRSHYGGFQCLRA